MLFGTVADLYERARPGYPPEIAESILAYHGGTPASVVEIGAGTGKGTDVLARLGAPLTCVEPDALMAARLAERFPDARVEATTFERWAAADRRGGRARLRDGLALAGRRHPQRTRPPRPGTRRHARRLRAPLRLRRRRPAGRRPGRAAIRRPHRPERPVDWFHQDILDSGQFDDVRREVFRRELPLDKERYLALMRTFGPYLSRTPEQQRRGIAALDRLVDDFGGTVVLDLRTTLVLGRADAR